MTRQVRQKKKEKKEMLMLGQFEKRLSRCTVPLPRPSKSSAAQWRRRGAETELEHNPAQGAEGVDETGSITARTRARSGYFHEKGKLLRAAEAQFFHCCRFPAAANVCVLCVHPWSEMLPPDCEFWFQSGAGGTDRRAEHAAVHIASTRRLMNQTNNLADFTHREEAACKNTVGFRADPLLALKSGWSNQVLAQWGEPTPVWRCATMWDQFSGKNSPGLLFF